ncbi:MAG: hypothetical protein ACYTGG_01625 [Planctomycetota bacterium]
MSPLFRPPAARLALAAGLLVAGCRATPIAEPDEPADASSGRIRLHDGTSDESPDANSDLDRLARQAEADVAAFLRRRDEAAAATSTDPGGTDPTTTPAPPVVTAPRRLATSIDGAPATGILWSDRLPAADDAGSARDGKDRADPPFTPGPLFRDPSSLEPVIDPPPPAANVSPSTLGADRINELIVQLSGELYREAAYDDVPLRQLLLIAALTIADPDRALQPEAIGGLTDRERELLGQFQAFFAAVGRDLDGERDVEAVLGEAVADLRRALSREPQLTLPRAMLCTRVGGFGDFTEFTRLRESGSYAFLAHAEQRAIVYMEITDFTSELNEAGEWVTELSQQLVIYADRDGIPVWKKDWEPVVDRTRNQRSDFFTVQIITLPKALSVGRYHLKLRVRDEQSGAEAETGIPFQMVADPKMTSGG